MKNHTSKVLEWNKIKEKLKELCQSPLGELEVDNLECLNNLSDINLKLNESLEMKKLLEETSFPKIEIFNITPELDRSKIQNSYLSTEELLRVAVSLKACREIRQHILQFKDRFIYLLKVALEIETFKMLEDKIFGAIDPNGMLTDKASPELKLIRQDIRHKKSNIEKKLHSILRHKDNLPSIQEPIVTLRENRYVIPIKKDHKGKLKGIVLDTSNSGETLFIEPDSVIEENNSLIALFRMEKEEEIRILKRFTTDIREKHDLIKRSLEKSAYLDIVYAKGKLAIKINANMPDINDKGIFKLFNARHPLLKGNVVPINIFIGEDYNILIITGPNTGGKTVALKTLGLLSIMAMAGLLIPAQEGSRISITDNIFIDSGDEQSIEQNLSTFSGHIKRIIQIIQHATHKSLVLIDEIGAGTDPKEGSTLSIVLLDRLREIGCKVMVSTHYSNLKSYHLMHQGVENTSCEFDIETLKPTYKLIYGVSGKSNALEIARRLGLDEKIVAKAEMLIKEEMSPQDNLIDSIYEEKDRVSKLIERYNKKLNELSLKESELKIKEDIIKREAKDLKEKQLNEDLNIIAETRKKVIKLFDNVRESNFDREKLKETLIQVEEERSKTQKALEEIDDSKPPVDSDYEWHIGDSVHLISLNKSGKINAISKSSVTVQIGDIKVKTDFSDLQFSSSTLDLSPYEEIIPSYNTSESSAPLELYLLGLRGDEAVTETEKYIESLYLLGREKGRIVHGKGAGILRTRIEEVLKKHPHVKSFNLARPEEGGYGVTEILLK
ncbi:MAG: endonuclease MutS2 [Spirochaetota bacterium]|nr:endonuclease MutS2 [Spirochaetota bacterium]